MSTRTSETGLRVDGVYYLLTHDGKLCRAGEYLGSVGRSDPTVRDAWFAELPSGHTTRNHLTRKSAIRWLELASRRPKVGV